MSQAPSLLDLYKKVSNPTRTNKDKIHLRRSPFVVGEHHFQNSARLSPPIHSSSRKAPQEPSEQSYRRSSRHSSRRSSRHSSERSSRRSSTRQARRSAAKSTRPKFFSEVPDSRRTRLGAMDQRAMEEEKLREKTVLLHELSRMEMSGSKMARQFSISDPLADIEFELNRTRAKEDCVSTVSFMKDSIRLGVTGVELLNNRFKVLKLQGWSGEATKDMSRYDRSLTKLYTRYMRRGSVSPIVELGFLIFGSMLVTHMKNAFLGPSTSGPSMFSAAPSAPPPPSRNIPFTTPDRQHPQQQQHQQQQQRPTMRRPTTNGTMSGPLGNIMERSMAPPPRNLRPPPVTMRPPPVTMQPPPVTMRQSVGNIAIMMMGPTPTPSLGGPEISEDVEIDVQQRKTRGGDATSIDQIVTHEGDEDDEESELSETENNDEMAF